MKNPLKAKYVYLMLSVFGAISLSLIFFFMLYRFQGLRETIDQILDILKPFVYGGVLAYLLRPACNWYEDTLLPQVTGLFSLVTGVGQSVVKLFGFLLDFLIGLIVAVYLLSSRKRFAKQGVMLVRSALKPRWANLVLEEIAFVDRVFGGFIDGKIVDSAIIGVLCYIGCSLFKFPNALLVSAIVGITNVIPFFGPFIGAIPSTILIILEDPIKGLWFIVFVFGLQQLDGNIIGPKILGDKTGLSSFWVLFAITLFGGLWGLVGMIVGVPVVAVIYDLVKKLIRRGLVQNNSMEIWDEYHRIYAEEDPFPSPKDPDEDRGSEIPD